MDELSIAGVCRARPRRTQGFWQRQFDDAPTPAQRRFDVTFGIVMPVLCFVCDPVVFRGGLAGGGGLYSEYRLYAYTISALEIVSVTNEVAAALEDVREGRELSRERPRALRLAGAASGSSIYDELAWVYRRESDPVRRARLAKAYEQVTAGGDIKQRLAILSD